MFKRGLASILVLAIVPAANAGLNLGIGFGAQSPGDPVDNSMGPVEVNIDVTLSQTGGANIPIRAMTFDFGLTDSALELTDYAWEYNPGQQICVLVPAACGSGHEEFIFIEGSTTVNTTFASGTESLLNQLVLPGNGSLVLGHLTVTVPQGLEPGDYVVDAVNMLAPNNNTGARLDYNFLNPTTIWGPGAFEGGSTIISVVPEPATLALLALGGVAALRYRRKKA